MEIGSFIELEMPRGREFYSNQKDIARLNSGRAAIFYATQILNCKTVWMPYYQCETVRDFLIKKGLSVKYYHIDEKFDIIDVNQQPGEAVLIVNYFGIMSKRRMVSLAEQYKNVIVDNSQAFFAAPIDGAMNVYSARKFIGVPDGAYLIGENAHLGIDQIQISHSSDTSNFLLMRVEYGCEGKCYESRILNEERIDSEDVLRMSLLTRYILDGTDYKRIKKKRKNNFKYASSLFGDVNKINPSMYYDKTCTPMVYPLLVEDDTLLSRLLEKKHFQGHWWNYVRSEVSENDFEYWLSRYIIPVTIDQRYGRKELEFIRSLI